MHRIVRALLNFLVEQILYCGVSLRYGDRNHPANSFRTAKAPLSEFCSFFGFG